MARELKRSLSIAGHRTSLSLEREFWDALQDAAARRGVAVAKLVTEIDTTRGDRNLSSAVRVWLLAEAGSLLRGR
jgi:predicted DNA-binding ribbon-helix-helix protein